MKRREIFDKLDEIFNDCSSESKYSAMEATREMIFFQLT